MWLLLTLVGWSLCFLCHTGSTGIAFLSLWMFSFMILLKILSKLLIWDYSPYSLSITQRIGLFIVSHNYYVCLLYAFNIFHILCLVSPISVCYRQTLIFYFLHDSFYIQGFFLKYEFSSCILQFFKPILIKLDFSSMFLFKEFSFQILNHLLVSLNCIFTLSWSQISYLILSFFFLFSLDFLNKNYDCVLNSIFINLLG